VTAQTREWVENYDPSPLMDGQAFWSASQDNWVWHSGRMRNELDAASENGTWKGLGQKSALGLALADETRSKMAAAEVVAAQATASAGAASLSGLHSTATSAIMAAEDPDPAQGNFTVTPQLGVEDRMQSYESEAQRDARQAMAEFHSERINTAVSALRTEHETVTSAMRAHAANLSGMNVMGGQLPSGGMGGVQMVGHGFKTDGPSNPVTDRNGTPYEPGYGAPSPLPPTPAGTTHDGSPVVKNPQIARPPVLINDHGGRTPVPADPRDHNGTTKDIVDGIGKIAIGIGTEEAGVLAAPATGGASLLASIPGGALPIYDGLDDLSRLTNMGRLPDAPPVEGQDGPG
jgi:hypothetical protein